MAQNQPRNEVQHWRTELGNLNWSQGFTKQELEQRFPNIPRSYFQTIPSGRKFYSFTEFWNIFMPVGAVAEVQPADGSDQEPEVGGPGTVGR